MPLKPSSSPSCSTASTSMDVASPVSSTRTSRRRRSSWSQLVLQIAVLALVMCSTFTTTDSLPIGDNAAEAVRAAMAEHYNSRFINNNDNDDGLSERSLMNTQFDLSSLAPSSSSSSSSSISLCQNTYSAGIRALCSKLAQGNSLQQQQHRRLKRQGKKHLV